MRGHGKRWCTDGSVCALPDRVGHRALCGRGAGSTEAMKEDPAIAVAEAIGKLVHGTNVLDGQRAMIAVMSCGICTSAKDSESAEKLCKLIVEMLVDQVAHDYPKIKAMMAKGEVNAFVLPERIM